MKTFFNLHLSKFSSLPNSSISRRSFSTSSCHFFDNVPSIILTIQDVHRLLLEFHFFDTYQPIWLQHDCCQISKTVMIWVIWSFLKVILSVGKTSFDGLATSPFYSDMIFFTGYNHISSFIISHAP